MFANRRTSQKPNEEFYAAFKQSFPEVGPGTDSASAVQGLSGIPAQRSVSLSEALIDVPSTDRYVGQVSSMSMISSPPTFSNAQLRDTMASSLGSNEHKDESSLRHDYFGGQRFDNGEDSKEQDATPRPFQVGWRLTPSLMDPNSFAFANFANQPPGYYTPTPGGFSTLYHPQAGGLHTPGMGMNAPLSMPHSMHALHAQDSILHLQHFNPQFLHQQQFHDPFPQTHQQQQSFAPTSFLQHRDSEYIESSSDKTTSNQSEMGMPPPSMHQQQVQQSASTVMSTMPMGEKFSYHVTLNAPTAMIKHSDEIPVTYLNKGQAYTMAIYDTVPVAQQQTLPLRYRTFVRICFEDEQQRAKTGACWQLWKEGRGSNEAHQRGGRLLAVEYVSPDQGGDDELRKSQIELEHASFDGFSVLWYPNPSPGGPDCSISVRFNFLSTDFSHSKGVKGIPVRLCTKTELMTHPLESPASDESEVCYARVKLFRDHGAERKLSNDVAHVKKSIEKLKQQIAQAESGLGNAGKRKRSSSMVKAGATGPGKAPKHGRTWPVDSEAGGGRLSGEEDLHFKLSNLQDMFSSTRPLSLLYLRGDPEDDPDLHPVQLTADSGEFKPISRTMTWESRQDVSRLHRLKPSVSDNKLCVCYNVKTDAHGNASISYPRGTRARDDNEDKLSHVSSRRPVKILKREHEETPTKPALFAVDVDKTYKPPQESQQKPIASFYVRQKGSTKEYYRALYLMQRTVTQLINAVSHKFWIDPHRVTQVTHVNSKGLHIIVDEDVVRELPEGQDMTVEFAPAPGEDPMAVRNDFVPPAVTEIITDGDIEPTDKLIPDPLELWLHW